MGKGEWEKVKAFFIPLPFTHSPFPLLLFPLSTLLLIIFCASSCANTNPAQKGNKASMATAEQSAPVIYTALGDSTGVGVGSKEGAGYVARLFERIKSAHPQSRPAGAGRAMCAG